MERPDYGDPVVIHPGEVPAFWACGVTPQAVALEARPELMITHEPGIMFLTNLPRDRAAGSEGSEAGPTQAPLNLPARKGPSHSDPNRLRLFCGPSELLLARSNNGYGCNLQPNRSPDGRCATPGLHPRPPRPIPATEE